MTIRFSDAHVDTWRKEGAVVVPKFFNDQEIKDVIKDFEIIFIMYFQNPQQILI